MQQPDLGSTATIDQQTSTFNPAKGTSQGGDGAAHHGLAPVPGAATKPTEADLARQHTTAAVTEVHAKFGIHYGDESGGAKKLVEITYDPKAKEDITKVVHTVVYKCLNQDGIVDGVNELEAMLIQLWKDGCDLQQGEIITSEGIANAVDRKFKRTADFNLDNLTIDQRRALSICLQQRLSRLLEIKGLERRDPPSANGIQEVWQRIQRGQEGSSNRITNELEMNRAIGDEKSYRFLQDLWHLEKKFLGNFFVNPQAESRNAVRDALKKLFRNSSHIIDALDSQSLFVVLTDDTIDQSKLDNEIYNAQIAARQATAHVKVVGAEDPRAFRQDAAYYEALTQLRAEKTGANLDITQERLLEQAACRLALQKIVPRDVREAIAGVHLEHGLNAKTVVEFREVAGHAKPAEDGKPTGKEAERKDAEKAKAQALEEKNLEEKNLASTSRELINIRQQIRLKEETLRLEIAKKDQADTVLVKSLNEQLDTLRGDQREQEKTVRALNITVSQKKLAYEAKDEAYKKLGGEATVEGESVKKAMVVVSEIVGDVTKINERMFQLWGFNPEELSSEETKLFNTIGELLFGPSHEKMQVAFGTDNAKLKLFLLDVLGIRGVDMAALRKDPAILKDNADITKQIHDELVYAMKNQKGVLEDMAFRAWNACMRSSLDSVKTGNPVMDIDMHIEGIRPVVTETARVTEIAAETPMDEALTHFDVHPGINAVVKYVTLASGEKVAITANPTTWENMVVGMDKDNFIDYGWLERRDGLGNIEATYDEALRSRRDEIFTVLGMDEIKTNLLDSNSNSTFKVSITLGGTKGIDVLDVVRTADGNYTIDGIPWQTALTTKHKDSLEVKARTAIEHIERASAELRNAKDFAGEVENTGVDVTADRKDRMLWTGNPREAANPDPATAPNFRKVEFDLAKPEPVFRFLQVRAKGPRSLPIGNYYTDAGGHKVYYYMALDGGDLNLSLIDQPGGLSSLGQNKASQVRQALNAAYYDMLDSWDTVKGYKENFTNLRIPANGHVYEFEVAPSGEVGVRRDGQLKSALEALNDDYASGILDLSAMSEIRWKLGLHHLQTINKYLHGIVKEVK